MFFRTVECVIFLFLALYIAFLLYFILFNSTGLDSRFMMYAWLLIFIEVLRMNGFLGLIFLKSSNEMHVRYLNETEKDIINGFFERDREKFETPVFFVQDNPDCYSAFVETLYGKIFYVLNERLFQSCSVREIWAILAHEKGHVENGDITGNIICLVGLKNWFLYLSLWFSVLVLLKIFWYVLFLSPEILLFSLSVCRILACVVVFFCVGLRYVCNKWIDHSTEVLADNSGAQILGSARWMLECLQMLDSRIDFPEFPLREKALLWVLKK